VWYQEKQVSTCKTSTEVSHNITLPHFGRLWRSLAAYEATMMLKIIFMPGGLGKSISNLILSVNGEYAEQ
jgi:hypothetical protein